MLSLQWWKAIDGKMFLSTAIPVVITTIILQTLTEMLSNQLMDVVALITSIVMQQFWALPVLHLTDCLPLAGQHLISSVSQFMVS